MDALTRIADYLESKARALQAAANDMGTVHGEALDRARERRMLALSLLFVAESIRSALKAGTEAEAGVDVPRTVLRPSMTDPGGSA